MSAGKAAAQVAHAAVGLYRIITESAAASSGCASLWEHTGSVSLFRRSPFALSLRASSG